VGNFCFGICHVMFPAAIGWRGRGRLMISITARAPAKSWPAVTPTQERPSRCLVSAAFVENDAEPAARARRRGGAVAGGGSDRLWSIGEHIESAEIRTMK